MFPSFRNDGVFREFVSEHDPCLADIIGTMPDWCEKEISITCVLGGLSNKVYRIEINGISFIARVPGNYSTMFGGESACEISNTLIAGQCGVGPYVLKPLPEYNGLIMEFIQGISLTPQLLQDDRIIEAVVDAMKKLHSGQRFTNDFSVFQLSDRLTATLRRLGSPLPNDFPLYEDSLAQIRQSLESHPVELVPCHNDAFPKNWILDRSRQARLIDFEFSGNNDPAFELATLYVECKWSRETLQHVCDSYYERSVAADVSRVLLQSIFFDYTWSLYALVRAALDPKCDGISIAEARWARVRANLNATEWARHMEIIRG